MMWDDTTLLFSSLPSDTVIVIKSDTVKNEHQIKLYKSTVKQRNDYQQAVVFDKFNTTTTVVEVYVNY